MRSLLAILFLCASASGQGLTLTDVGFVAVVSAPALGGGGGGSPAPGPTEYWDFQEASGNRVGEVAGTIWAEEHGSVSATTGIYGNAAAIPDSYGGSSFARGFEISGTVPSYTTDQDLSVNLWHKFVDTSQAGYAIELDIWANGFGDFIQLIWNPSGGDAFYTFETWTASVWHGAGHDSIETVPLTLDSNWHMFTLVYNGTTDFLSFYMDGTLIGTTDSPIVFTNSGALDGIDLLRTNGMNGQALDEGYLKVGYALNQDEIDWQWNGGLGRQFSDY